MNGFNPEQLNHINKISLKKNYIRDGIQLKMRLFV